MRPSRVPRRSPEKAFESLYERHFREIFGYSLALLHSPADAEDATQATFLNAYRAFERGERPRHPASWLRAIALNVCREHFRRASRRPEEVSLEEDPGELVVEPPEPAIGDVVRALSHLPFNQRAALVMREFEGRPVTEIADLLDVTSAAVETLLFRARRALREQLEGSCFAIRPSGRSRVSSTAPYHAASEARCGRIYGNAPNVRRSPGACEPNVLRSNR